MHDFGGPVATIISDFLPYYLLSSTLVHVKEDALSVLSSIRREKKLQLMKKRWLMGVPKDFKLSKRSFNDLRKPIFSADIYLSEPFLRNDSVFLEVARGYLANCFSSFNKGQPMGNFINEIVFPSSEDVRTSQTRGRSVVRKVFLPLLDDLSNKALCFLADLVTSKSEKFEKTRPRLESVIKKYLPIIFKNPSSFEDALRLQTQIMEVFRDPKNFKNHIQLVDKPSTSCVRDVDVPSTSCVCDVHVILERLEDLSLHALDAMRRKLCMSHCSLYTEPCTNRTKKQLIGTLRNKIDKLLKDGLPNNLARALRVGSLSIKLINGHFDSTLPEFFKVSHEIEVLQNEILKAIWYVPNLPLDEVKKLLLLLELDAKNDIHFIRTKIKNFLIECLFQCDELEIPESIRMSISTINSYSRESTTREKIEDELICMLNMGSCMKQLVWDLSEHPNIDQEFWGAYKDESEDGDSSNDDDDDDDDDHIDDKEDHCSNYEKVDRLVGNVSSEATHMEKQEDVSAGMRKNSITSTLPLLLENDGKSLRKGGEKILRVISDKSLPEEDLHVLHERCHFMPMDEPCLPKKPESWFPTLSELAKPSITDSDLSALQDVSGNEYLIIEGVCNEVSLFAHKFIGCLIEKLLKVEGNHLDSASRSYLLGGASVPEKHKGKMPKSSCEDMDCLVFIQALNELVPSFPESGMRRLLKVLKQS